MTNTEPGSLSRRTFLWGAAAGAATLGLAACGSGESPATPTTTATGGGKRMFQTVGGAVEIPASPQKVCCTTYQTAVPLFDVGYSPAAVGDVPNLDTYIGGEVLGKYQALPKIGSWTEIDLEQLTLQRPDLIMATGVPGWEDPKLPEFKKIQPSTVVFVAAKTSDWTTVAVDVADAVGLKPKAEELRKRYTDRSAEIKSRHAATLGRTTWSMVYEVSYGEGQWSLLFPDGWIGVVLADAGVRFGSASGGKTGTGASYSLEKLTLLDDSDVIVAQADHTGKLVKSMQDLTTQPGWSNLKAAKANQVFPMPNFYTVSYSSALAVLDTLEETLNKLG